MYERVARCCCGTIQGRKKLCRSLWRRVWIYRNIIHLRSVAYRPGNVRKRSQGHRVYTGAGIFRFIFVFVERTAGAQLIWVFFATVDRFVRPSIMRKEELEGSEILLVFGDRQWQGLRNWNRTLWRHLRHGHVRRAIQVRDGIPVHWSLVRSRPHSLQNRLKWNISCEGESYSDKSTSYETTANERVYWHQ